MTWKEAFLSTPSISIRKGIAHNYDAPYEDTSTLVLTASSHKFVDIRFPRQISHNEDGTPLPLISHASFWAFSGVSSTSFYDERDETRLGFEFTSHTLFKHDIDSKGPGITDEGDCFLLPNGDVMEVGMFPGSGQLYKELWTEPVPTCGRKDILKKPVIVAETVRSSPIGRGLIIRIGDYVQGIFEQSNESLAEKVLVQRWTKDMYEEGADAEWRIDHRSNVLAGGLLPCHVLTEDKVHLGFEFQYQEVQWQITEYDS